MQAAAAEPDLALEWCMQVSHDYFEDAMAFFTTIIYVAIKVLPHAHAAPSKAAICSTCCSCCRTSC